MSSELTTKFKQALEAQEYQIESGVVVKLKRVGLMDLVLAGAIPDSLSAVAAQVASTITARQMSVEELKRYGKLVDAVVTAAMVEPAIGQDVAIEAIPFSWKVKIFNWANTSAGVLRPFRSEQAGSLETT